MSVSPSFRSFVEDQLLEVVPVRTRAMFGGVGIDTEGLFFGLIADDVLFLKVDEVNRPDYEARGLEPFRPYGPDGVEMSFREIPADLLDDTDELASWVEKAVGAAGRAKEKKR